MALTTPGKKGKSKIPICNNLLYQLTSKDCSLTALSSARIPNFLPYHSYKVAVIDAEDLARPRLTTHQTTTNHLTHFPTDRPTTSNHRPSNLTQLYIYEYENEENFVAQTQASLTKKFLVQVYSSVSDVRINTIFYYPRKKLLGSEDRSTSFALLLLHSRAISKKTVKVHCLRFSPEEPEPNL
ncbi:hypothetical protein Glove_274g21 [Diversispora epigaea]|uniref:Uncharacterized protein n=1 Tax=Diversispora epigaea TaxID=1348612 RepID=A0A397IBP7_9GLOM|nr:hypothetical protein Glove_274g21 [Diversispora epigaea]